MTLGERIQKYRRLAGLSQEQLAEQMAVSRQAVSKWELGDTIPDADRIVQLAQLFGITTDTLLLGEPTSEPEASAPPFSPSTANEWPGRLGRLFRQKGYIAGYLLAAYAGGAFLLFRIAHFGFSQMLRPMLELEGFGDLGGFGGFGGFGFSTSAMMAPLTIVNILSILALIIAIAGIVLALVWKKRSKKDSPDD